MNATWTTTTNNGPVIVRSYGGTMTATPPAKPKYQPSIEVDVLNDCQLAWWNICGYANDYNDDGRASRCVYASYERKGWLGLTVTNMSDIEYRALTGWAKGKGKDVVYISKRDFCDGEIHVTSFIGSYEDYCLNFWFSTEELMDEFDLFLEQFPKRTTAMLIDNIDAAKQIVKGKNYKILEGALTNALALPEDIDDTDMMLLRLIG